MFKRLVEICSEIWVWLYVRDLTSMITVFALLLGVPIILAIKNTYYASVENKEKIKQSYSVKVLNLKGETVEVYQNKTVEIKENLLYICPQGTKDCSRNTKAIVINANYIIKPED